MKSGSGGGAEEKEVFQKGWEEDAEGVESQGKGRRGYLCLSWSEYLCLGANIFVYPLPALSSSPFNLLPPPPPLAPLSKPSGDRIFFFLHVFGSLH